MELQIARQIIDTLAQGIHPVTGEAMPEDSPYNAPPVIRALHAVSRALEGLAAVPAADEVPPASSRTRRVLPPNAGKAWSAQDDAALQTAFDAGIPMKQVAQELGRTPFALEQRLVKLGKIAPPAGGGRYGTTAAN
jgi:hypothetical protein